MLPPQHVPILCVDDSPSVTEMLSHVLKAAGYEVDVAENGLVALARLNRDLARYPVVITDMRMPGLDGYGLISQARTAGYGGVFIALASMFSPDDRQRLRELGVARVLEKPSRRTDILDAVREAISGY